MKKAIFLFICFVSLVSSSDAQAIKKLLGKWKVIKFESPPAISFDLDSLTTTYQKFFSKQKHKIYHDTITANDSLFIQVQFEKAVNDISRMFISFKDGNRYETNSYDRQGNLTENTEKGTFRMNLSKNEIYTFPDGNKNRPGRFAILYADNTKLIIKMGNKLSAAVFTCRKTIL